jgi:adenylosuccinate synthase
MKMGKSKTTGDRTMASGQVIIGSNYGDEGKGLMTDYFASQAADSSLVVRFNGGAQAGHTVVSPDGRRHVFSHFGSGSFLACPTYLSRYFIVNPMLFVKELDDLERKGVYPRVFLDEAAIVTTPFDVFINQALETRRAGNRHGSCGVGINETVTRCLRSAESRLCVRDLLDEGKLTEKLCALARTWLPARLAEHNLDAGSEPIAAFLARTDRIIDRYVLDCSVMLEQATVTKCCPAYRHIIFEGAQGLLLDEARLDLYPHLTRSRTGLTNVVELARQMRLEELNVCYASRSYLTRHGAGPLAGEDRWSFPDHTNVPNQFQGTLRFAALDLEQLRYSINLDLAQAKFRFPNIKACMAITCTDQMSVPSERFLPVPLRYVSSGETRNDVKEKPLRLLRSA